MKRVKCMQHAFTTRQNSMSTTDPSDLPKTPSRFELPPAETYDPVIEAYKKDVDRTLLRENLKLTPAQRAEKFERAMAIRPVRTSSTMP